MPTTRRLAALLPALAFVALAAGCHSDGQPGVTGKVRFSQVLDYADTNDFTAPVAVGSTLLVALQAPGMSAVPGAEAGLTLVVEQGGKPAGSVSPMGFGQFAVVLPSPGAYDLVAESGGTELDHLPVTAEAVHALRLSERFEVESRGSQCTVVASETSGLDHTVLHANQQLTVYAVPVDESGAPMVGLLALTADAPDTLGLGSPFVGGGIRANALTLSPAGTLGSPAMVTVRDSGDGLTTSLDLATSPDDAPVDCQP